MSVAPRTARSAAGGPADDRRALARCVADPAGFATAWGRRPLLASAAELPGPFDDLLDLDGVDELLSRRGLRTPFLRMAKDGAVVDSSRFTRPGGVGAAIGDQVDDSAVARLFAEGTTIVLQALHRLWPPIIEFAGALAGELGHPVQVNAYITPAASRGFSAHYDIHDVFILQLAGEKRWIVHEPVHEWPLRTQSWTSHRDRVADAVATTEPTIDAVLRPGDALYLPRGFLHSAEALGDVAAHLTVGIHVVTRHALVEALLAEAEDVTELREALPVGLDLSAPGELGDDVATTIDLLVDRLRNVTPETVVSRLERALAGSMRPAPISPLAQASAADAVEADTRVRLRPGLEVRRVTSENGVELCLPGESVTFDASLEDAVAALLDDESCVVDALPGDPHAVRGLVRTLLVRGVVVTVGD
jgi:cupin superfamily protein